MKLAHALLSIASVRRPLASAWCNARSGRRRATWTRWSAAPPGADSLHLPAAPKPITLALLPPARQGELFGPTQVSMVFRCRASVAAGTPDNRQARVAEGGQPTLALDGEGGRGVLTRLSPDGAA